MDGGTWLVHGAKVTCALSLNVCMPAKRRLHIIPLLPLGAGSVPGGGRGRVLGESGDCVQPARRAVVVAVYALSLVRQVLVVAPPLPVQYKLQGTSHRDTNVYPQHRVGAQGLVCLMVLAHHLPRHHPEAHLVWCFLPEVSQVSTQGSAISSPANVCFSFFSLAG